MWNQRQYVAAQAHAAPLRTRTDALATVRSQHTQGHDVKLGVGSALDGFQTAADATNENIAEVHCGSGMRVTTAPNNSPMKPAHGRARTHLSNLAGSVQQVAVELFAVPNGQRDAVQQTEGLDVAVVHLSEIQAQVLCFLLQRQSRRLVRHDIGSSASAATGITACSSWSCRHWNSPNNHRDVSWRCGVRCWREPQPDDDQLKNIYNTCTIESIIAPRCSSARNHGSSAEDAC